MNFTKTDTKWTISYISPKGDVNVDWWHPLTIPDIAHPGGPRIEVTLEMLERIFASPEVADEIIGRLDHAHPYYEPPTP